MAFSIIPPSPLADCRRLVLISVRLYATGVKRLAPFRTLKSIAGHVVLLCEISLSGPDEDSRTQSLKQQMEDATSLREYEECTTHLDHIQGHDAWKADKLSIEPQYNPDILEQFMAAIREAVMAQDPDRISRLITSSPGSLARDVAGINMLRLYKHSWFGTKRLVDNYLNTIWGSLGALVTLVIRPETAESEVERHLNTLERTLHGYGRSALTLSGGAIMGMKHVGVVKCLWEADQLPEIISGASAGSIVAAIIGSNTDEQMRDILGYFPDSNLAVFDDAGTEKGGWWFNRWKNALISGALFDPQYLKVVMEGWLGDITFREAYNKTRRVINICVSGKDAFEPRVLNYVTAPDVYIWSAVCASCAVPFVFPGASIYEKDPVSKAPRLWMRNAQQKYVDGSLDHDIPVAKLQEMFHVNFLIVSQVNPHVRMMLTAEERFTGRQPRWSFAWSRFFLNQIKTWVRDDAIHRLAQVCDIFSLPELWFRWTTLLTQQYTGDIDIFPELHYSEYSFVMANPTSEFIRGATRDGERATWPKMSRIKNSVDIELTLMKNIRILSDRLHFSPEARASREAERAARREARRGDGARPNFLRRKSLSDLDEVSQEQTPQENGGSTMRRNRSLEDLDLRRALVMTPANAPSLPPQAGLEGMELVMTERAPEVED